MKKSYIILPFLFLFFIARPQDTFVGTIKFKTKIELNGSASEETYKRISATYGDGMEMFYNRNGNFIRRYFNSGEAGLESEKFAYKGNKLYIKMKNIQNEIIRDVSINSLKFISSKKIPNEYIMNLDCECYEYVSEDERGKTLKINYCFSKLFNKIYTKIFEKYKDYFISDFFITHKRPYLKYVLQTDEFTLTFSAIKYEKPK